MSALTLPATSSRRSSTGNDTGGEHFEQPLDLVHGRSREARRGREQGPHSRSQSRYGSPTGTYSRHAETNSYSTPGRRRWSQYVPRPSERRISCSGAGSQSQSSDIRSSNQPARATRVGEPSDAE